MNQPIICFGQQPNGFFPKRFFVAKILSARNLQAKIGGRIVLFYHDSDADYRETITIMTDRQTGAEVRLNFLQPNKIQKKFSPLYAKKITSGWKEEALKQLPRFVDQDLINIFKSVDENLSVANFCLKMYQEMGLLEGIEIFRSSDKNFREKAIELDKKYYADVEYQGEIVRAKIEDFSLSKQSVKLKEPDKSGNYGEAEFMGTLHEGGNQFIRFPINQPIKKNQKNPGRDQRFAWMQSVIKCTHYITGASEDEYLIKKNFPDVTFITREQIDQANYAWTKISNL